MTYATTNPQTIPRDLKRLWIADPGHLLVWGDWKSIESVLTAYFAKDRERLKIVHEGGDLYAHAAASLYDCEPTKSAAKSMRVDFGGTLRPARDAAKTFDLARGYWMGPGTFSEKHGLTAKEAKRLIEAHDSRWPALARWRPRTAWLAHSQRYLDTPFHWRRYFWTPFSGSQTSIERWGDAREAVSHLPQSTAASIFKRTLTKLPPQIVWAARHDEIVLHVREDTATAMGERLKVIMEQPWPQLRDSDLYPDGLWISAEIGIGRRWGVDEQS